MMPQNSADQYGYGTSQPAPQNAPQYPNQGGIPPVPPQYPNGQGQQPSSPIFQAPPAQRDRSKLWLIVSIVLLVLFIAAGSFAIWAYGNYKTADDDVQGKIAESVAAAKKDQANTDQARFLEAEKQPNAQFVGPDNYGRVTFSYPKTWSAYVASDTDSNGGTYQAYLNPGVVPPVSGTNPVFALRVTIQQTDITKELNKYSGQIKNGKLKSSSFSANGHNGTRLDGNFTDKLRGSAVLLQIRDKVVTIRTDADTFMGDFDAIIKTINFND